MHYALWDFMQILTLTNFVQAKICQNPMHYQIYALRAYALRVTRLYLTAYYSWMDGFVDPLYSQFGQLGWPYYSRLLERIVACGVVNGTICSSAIVLACLSGSRSVGRFIKILRSFIYSLILNILLQVMAFSLW